MEHTVLAGGELNECAKVHDAHDFAQIYIPDLDILGDAFDDAACLGSGGFIGRGDVHAAVVLNVDLHAGLGNDLVDHLSAGSNDLANLFRIDGEADNLGRVLAQMLSGLCQRLQHDLQDVEPSVISLLQSPLQNGAVDTGNLNIHLDGGDALNRTGDLEVHIAQEVFQTLNIGQHGHIAAFRILDQAHGHTSNGSLDRNAGVHQAQGAAAHGSHGTGAVGGQDLAHQTQRVRELFLGGDHGQQSTLRQRTVADLASAGALHASCFAGGVGGHVVVVHIALAVLSAQTVQHLHVAHGAQRGHGQGLRLAAGENGAAVGAG